MRNLKNSKRFGFCRLINVYDMKFEDERLILRRLILKFVEESGKKTPSSCVGRWLRSGLVGGFGGFIILSGGGGEFAT